MIEVGITDGIGQVLDHAVGQTLDDLAQGQATGDSLNQILKLVSGKVVLGLISGMPPCFHQPPTTKSGDLVAGSTWVTMEIPERAAIATTTFT